MPVAPEEKVLFSELLPEFSRLERDADRQAFLSRYPMLVRAGVVEELAGLVLEKLRLDAREALRIDSNSRTGALIPL